MPIPSLYFPLVDFGVSATGFAASTTGSAVSTLTSSTLAGASGSFTSAFVSTVVVAAGAGVTVVVVVVVVAVSAFFPQETKEKRTQATRRAIRIFFIFYLPFIK